MRENSMPPKEQSLLVVEDEPVLQTLISKTLERYGFRVLRAADGVEALALWEQEQPDLIMLDLRLPRIDGFEVCRRVRQSSIVPIIVLTALSEESDKVTAFDLGADDYLTKPFGVEELRARVGAVLRRSRWREQAPSPATRRFGRLTVNLGERRLLRDEQEVCLTHTEWALFEELVTHADTTMSHRTLLQRVWGDAYAEESKYLRAYIGRLRRKLEDDPARPHYLLTEPGVGYRFVSQQTTRARPAAALTRALHTTRLGNLPAQLISVIGRKQDMEAACALMRRPEPRLLTFTGPPGVGKTRLGLQVASVLLDEFAHGAFFVALAPISDPSLVIGTIARTLGVKETGSQPLIERLKAHLSDKQMLLLLDNFEQVVEAAPRVAELLGAAPRLKVIVTSRAALHIYGEHEYVVAPLVLPSSQDAPTLDLLAQSPAVNLFTIRARAVKSDFALTEENARAVAAICARLDGLPLAIELAAAQIKLLSPQVILSRLDSRLQVLTGGARDLPARHQTLRGAIDWSYDLLDAQEQALFARLGVFVGGCTLEAAQAVCGSRRSRGPRFEDDRRQVNGAGDARATARSPVIDGLVSLIDKSLLRQISDVDDQPRFMMLETIREYALERLVEHGEAEVLRRRHAAYFQTLAEEAEPQLRGPQLKVYLEQLESEHDNIRAALQWALERGDVEMVMQTASALWRFWEIHSHLSEGRHWLEAALAQTQPAGDLSPRALSARAKALTVAGMLALWQLDQKRSILLCEESLKLYRELGDAQGIALALNNLGNIVRDQGDIARANELYAESLALYREAEVTWGIAAALHNLGLLPLKAGDYPRAQALFEESLELFRELGNLRGMALAFTHLAEVARNQGHCGRASELFEEALILHRDIGDREGVTCNLEGLAGVAAAQGQPVRVARLYGAAAAQRELIGAPMLPYERSRYEQIVAVARVQIDAVAWAEAWAEGRALRAEQAIAYALSQDESTTDPEGKHL